MHRCEPLRLHVRRVHSYSEKRRPKQELLACYKQTDGTEGTVKAAVSDGKCSSKIER